MSSPPTKPPRGVKQGKETSGLLMSVIRTLSASESDEQRDKERRRLERELARSDERLGALVVKHEVALARVAALAAEADIALGAADQRAASVAARLAAAERLLVPRGPDLSALWREARALRHALLLLANADLLSARDREAREAAASGRVLRAALLLADARDREPPAPALAATVDRLRAAERDLLADLPRRLCRALLSDPDRRPPADPQARALKLIAELETTRAPSPDPDATPDPDDPAPLLAAAAALGDPPEVAARFAALLPTELAALAARVRTEPGTDAAEALEKRLVRMKAAWRAIDARLIKAAPGLVSPARYWCAVEEATLSVVRGLADAEVGDGEAVTAEAGETESALAAQFGRRRTSRRGRLYVGAASGLKTRVGAGGGRADVLGAALRGCRGIAEDAAAGGGAGTLREWAAAAGRTGATRVGARAAARVAEVSPADWCVASPGEPSLATGAVRAWEAIEEAAEWARGAAWCCGELRGATRAALDLLADHADTAVTRAAPPHSDPAAGLLADEDFARFLDSLPQHRAVLGGPDPDPAELRAALLREADALAAALPPRAEPAPPLRDLGPSALAAESASRLAERARSLPAPRTADRLAEAGRRALRTVRLELRAHVMYRAAEGDEGGARLAGEARAARARLAALSGARAEYVWGGLGAAAAAAAVRAGVGADAVRRGAGARWAGLERAAWSRGARAAGGAATLAAVRAGRVPAAVPAADAAAAVLAGAAGWSPERRRRALREVETALAGGGGTSGR